MHINCVIITINLHNSGRKPKYTKQTCDIHVQCGALGNKLKTCKVTNYVNIYNLEGQHRGANLQIHIKMKACDNLQTLVTRYSAFDLGI